MSAPAIALVSPLMAPSFSVGSVQGREHVRLGRNNQDAVVVERSQGRVIAVVTDGCGSGASSEVGARIGAAFLARELGRLFNSGALLQPKTAVPATRALVAHLRQLVADLEDEPQRLQRFVFDCLLFTFQCAVYEGTHALVFGVGDGAWGVDGRWHALDSGENNAPDYVAYRLLPREVLPAATALSRRPVIHHCGPARQVLLATDGLVPALEQGWFSALCEDEVIWRNPMQLTRKLRVANDRAHLFRDDATVALIKGRG